MHAPDAAREREPRPWPPPRRPWILKQVWHDLLFAHWPFEPERLRALVPPELPLDTFQGRAWIAVVPFRISPLRPRGLPPLPVLSSFTELNVRTYVTVEGKPGVYFWSLDASSCVAVAGARRFYHLPYVRARMAVSRHGEEVSFESRRRDHRLPPAELRVRYRPVAPARLAERGTLEDWLTARYCLYTVGRERTPRRCEIDHAPWPLQPASAVFESNTMLAPLGLGIPLDAPLLHFSRRLAVHTWPLERVSTSGG